MNVSHTNRSSRREFVKSVGIAGGVAALAPLGLQAEAAPLSRRPDPKNPEEVLASLLEGNQRFMNGTPSLLTRRRPADFADLAEGQTRRRSSLPAQIRESRRS